jgi:hypothetical protein
MPAFGNRELALTHNCTWADHSMHEATPNEPIGKADPFTATSPLTSITTKTEPAVVGGEPRPLGHVHETDAHKPDPLTNLAAIKTSELGNSLDTSTTALGGQPKTSPLADITAAAETGGPLNSTSATASTGGESRTPKPVAVGGESKPNPLANIAAAETSKPHSSPMDTSTTTTSSESQIPMHPKPAAVGGSFGHNETPTHRSETHESTPFSSVNTKPAEISKTQIPTNLDGAANPLENTAGTGVTGASAQKFAPKGSDVIPSESSSNPGVAPASGAAPTYKQQGADKPLADPEDNKTNDAEAILKKRDPNDHSGEPMHMHTGNEKDNIPTSQEERRESKIGLPGGQEHGKEPKGTGELWEKTTGLQAEGGNFDASKPGAGKEADRTLKRAASTVGSLLSRADMITGILEEKGIHRDAKGNMDGTPETASSASGEKEKVSKMDKLKDKLHIGHKDK